MPVTPNRGRGAGLGSVNQEPNRPDDESSRPAEAGRDDLVTGGLVRTGVGRG